MIDFNFLFGAMRILGFLDKFMGMMQMLFKDATANAKINGSQTTPFKIGREVWQGCPLAPYLFLIVAKVMNAMLKREVAT
jgi:hypothetical protein